MDLPSGGQRTRLDVQGQWEAGIRVMKVRRLAHKPLFAKVQCVFRTFLFLGKMLMEIWITSAMAGAHRVQADTSQGQDLLCQ
jgi:hypothetical protein